MAEKALDLFQAYAQNKLPKEGGYIVSTFFDSKSVYSIYEVVAYNGVKSIYLTEEGLTFQTDGCKLYVLIEPASYSKKYVEPVSRSQHEQIPHRFSELEIYTAKNQTKIMVSKQPIMTYSSFTILKPAGGNFSILFYNFDEVMESMEFFFIQTLNKEARVLKGDAKAASKLIIDGLNKFMIW
jgi:hypothetical protein